MLDISSLLFFALIEPISYKDSSENKSIISITLWPATLPSSEHAVFQGRGPADSNTVTTPRLAREPRVGKALLQASRNLGFQSAGELGLPHPQHQRKVQSSNQN